MDNSVYVLIANDGERVKECIVTSGEPPLELYHLLQAIYGGANVSMHSRMINDIPENIQRARMVQTMTPEQQKVWRSVDC